MLLDRPISNHTSRNGSPLRPAYASTTSFKPNNVHVADEVHPIFHEGRVAVVTGAASGIGRAACIEFAKLKLKIAIADVDETKLQAVGKDLSAMIGDANVLVIPTDVSQIDQVVRLKERVYEAWGEVAVLMNNAGIAPKGTSWDGIENWKKVFDVNVFGIVNVQQTFVPFPNPTADDPPGERSTYHQYWFQARNNESTVRFLLFPVWACLLIAFLLFVALNPFLITATSTFGFDLSFLILRNFAIRCDLATRPSIYSGTNVRSQFYPFGRSSSPYSDGLQLHPILTPSSSNLGFCPLGSTPGSNFPAFGILRLSIRNWGCVGLSISPGYSGNAAYNASKAAVKSLTESLAYELRERPDSHVTAHLFIPGWTHTGLTGGDTKAKPDGAWSAQETVLYMLDKVRAGEFYVLVPDNETRREVDELRIMWSAGDIVEGRPALSRWHRDYKALFEEYVRDGLSVTNEGSRSY
ncbi:hypothetical protein VNI00_003569 [Paramarasmius palmivorus]|uniref:NAD(P)-binding protein n=1 Tax=Paramarasmius palmivorus TaxID=297713 RepID=A0AAW0DTK7_9AGAR